MIKLLLEEDYLTTNIDSIARVSLYYSLSVKLISNNQVKK